MTSDTEPSYRLVDSNGNVVGSLFAEADGTLKLQEGTSGDDNELSFGTDGSLTVEQVSATSVNTDDLSATDAYIWQEDANSPLTISAASSGTITLNGSYDVVMCQIVSDSGNEVVDMRVNGDSGTNYSSIDASGTRISGATKLTRVAVTGASTGQTILLSGSWSNRFRLHNNHFEPISGALQAGQNDAITSPLDSITFLQPVSNNVSMKVEVYGRSI